MGGKESWALTGEAGAKDGVRVSGSKPGLAAVLISCQLVANGQLRHQGRIQKR